MKIAYLILAHNNPKHLKRLLNALSSESSAFFIHIDRKSNIGDFSGINGKNVHFCDKRIRVDWGDFSTVRAILTLIRTAFADDRRFEYFPLLSGTDYPVQPTPYIETFFHRFSRDYGAEFIDMVDMREAGEAAGKQIWRLKTYRHNPYASLRRRIWRQILLKSGSLARERDYEAHLRGLTPYGGWTWWTLSREACNYVLNFVDKNPGIVNFFKYTWIPDESFFQTILGNSEFKSRLRGGLTYANWDAGGAHPSLISDKDLELFKVAGPVIWRDIFGTREILFARKFSDEADEMVAKIDQILKEKLEIAKGDG